MKEGASYIVVAIAAILVVAEDYLMNSFESLSIVLLVAGSIFPGIPHGALDHKLSLSSLDAPSDRLLFIGRYLAIMLFVILIWVWMPTIGVALFILYSAWHFGETDTRSMHIFSPIISWVFGLSLLMFLFGTHVAEFNMFMSQMSSMELSMGVVLADWFAVTGLIGLIIPIAYIRKLNWSIWLSILLVLLLSTQLPLLMAFTLYFIGLHSIKGWLDIRSGLKLKFPEMLRAAFPFSAGAYASFALVWFAWNKGDLLPNYWVPVFFAFLAAISLPHILYMHSFYNHNTKSIE